MIPSSNRAMRQGGPLLLATLIGFNVCMQLGSALLLKLAPDLHRDNLLSVGLILAAVLLLNLVLFVTWGALHRRFPIGIAYPASAAFLPALLAMAWWLGEEISPQQLVGAAIVLFGVCLLISDQARRHE